MGGNSSSLSSQPCSSFELSGRTYCDDTAAEA